MGITERAVAYAGRQLTIEEKEAIRENAEKSLRKRYRREITGKFVKAINDYEMIRPGDRIAVCISGGKDSMLMAKLFQELKRRNKIPFEVRYLCMNPGYSALTLAMIKRNAEVLGIPLEIFEAPIFDSVDHIDKSPCYICARMRRGYLYRAAQEANCNKIALGHHYDDVIETTLMSILYSGQTQTMMPKLHSMNFQGMELIRPMYLIREEEIKKWRDANELQFIRCACHFTEEIYNQGHLEKSRIYTSGSPGKAGAEASQGFSIRQNEIDPPGDSPSTQLSSGHSGNLSFAQTNSAPPDEHSVVRTESGCLDGNSSTQMKSGYPADSSFAQTKSGNSDEHGPEEGKISRRVEVRNLIRELKKDNPSVEANIFRSMENICMNAVLGYKKDGQHHLFTEFYD